jgi:hypothetical protein
MYKTIAFSALLLGSTILTASPSEAAPPRAEPHHIIAHPRPIARARPHFVIRHDFRHFTPVEHRWWTGGRWRHTWWHGRYGWWWNVGPAWYFYAAPIYPYPEYVSPTYYDDESYDDEDGYDDQQGMDPGYGGGGGGVWYHCNQPEGYYPYVKSCNGGWEEVPANPRDMGAGPQGGPDSGPPPGYQGDEDQDDQGPPPPPGR